MKKPLVAIVGRPNVGKSTFFNRIVGKRVAIVEDKPGVTRDRVYGDAQWCGYNFTLIDTGGIDLKSDDQMLGHIRRQAEIAAQLADVILFFVSGKDGVLQGDDEIADFLRKSDKKIILVVNKIDNNENEKTYDFYSLGLGEPYAVSSEQGKGIGDVLDVIVDNFPEKTDDDTEEEVINIAVVGRPNAGKSSTVNRLLGYERVIVSDIAGTTRDAIDTPFVYDGKRYNIIDTAGMRRKRSIDENVEYYSVMRAFAAISRADVVLIVIDAKNDISEQDIRICGYVHEEGKPSVVLMNKWDAVEKDTHTINKFNDKLTADLKFMDYFVPLYVSALTGQRADKIMKEVNNVLAESRRRITTGVLNDVVQDAIASGEPPSKNGRRLKIYYVTQLSVSPPTFIFFVNDPEIMHFSYKRYLENRLRSAFTYRGTPIRLIIRAKKEKDL